MFELGARLALIGGGLVASFLNSGTDFSFCAGLAAVLAALEIFSYLLDVRQLRGETAVTWITGLEIGGLALWMADAGELSRFGVFVLVPMVLAAKRRLVRASTLAPVGAAALISANALAGRLAMFSPSVLVPAAAILVIGLLLENWTSASSPIVSETAPERPLTLTGDDYLELRESFRVLRQRYRDLEQRAERDHLVARLFELRQRNAGNLYPALAEMVSDFSGSEGAAIFGLIEGASMMTVKGATTDFPGELSQRTYPVESGMPERDLRIKLDASLRALPDAESRDFANLLLLHEGELVGMMCIGQRDAESLKECRDKATPLAPLIAALLTEEGKREEHRRELSEARTLYSLTSQGSSGGDEKISSMLSALVQTASDEDENAIALDAVSVCSLDGNSLGDQGARLDVLGLLRFEHGPGLDGWRAAGFPEIAVLDARTDPRCSSDAAIRGRVGSLYLAPLNRDGEVAGYFAAATHRLAGIDASTARFLAKAAGELEKALPMTAKQEEPHEDGSLSGPAFVQYMQGREGCLAVLEVLHVAKLAKSHGREQLEQAISKLQRRLLRQLPPQSVLCRRNMGEFLVFLCETSRDGALQWAASATASAALIGLQDDDGNNPKPLALRSKVAEITQSSLRESAGLAA